jgi:hypothetical protein
MMILKSFESGHRPGPFDLRFERLYRRVYGFLAGVLLLAGCQIGQPKKATTETPPKQAAAPALTEEQLTEQLGMLYARFVSQVTGATDSAMRQTDDPGL